MTTRKCWFRTIDLSSEQGRTKVTPWAIGTWHRWSQSYDEFECGPGHFPAAIVEDEAGRVHVVFAEYVAFGVEKPRDES